MQHIPGSSCNILPGSAPALHSVILYPFSPLPLPLAHPITLTPYPGAEPWSAPGRVNICFIFWREHCRFPHILRRNRWRTLEQDSRLGDPFQGAVTGFGSRLEHQPMDIKRGPWSISKTLEKYYVIPPACASGLVRQAVRFSVNRHTGSRSCGSNSSCRASSPSPLPRSGETPWRPGTAPYPSGPGRRSS